MAGIHDVCLLSGKSWTITQHSWQRPKQQPPQGKQLTLAGGRSARAPEESWQGREANELGAGQACMVLVLLGIGEVSKTRATGWLEPPLSSQESATASATAVDICAELLYRESRSWL